MKMPGHKDDEKEFAHESYGMVGFSRCTGSSGRMFGSSIPNHNTFIRLRLTRAIRRHALGRDWYHGERGTLYEVDLTPAQFAEMLTSMNVGSGIPCTIRYVDGKQVEEPPNELLEAQQIREDFRGKTEVVAKRLDGLKEKIDEILKKKSLTKVDREEVERCTMLIVQEVRHNLPFWLQQFSEATQKITTTAKAEVDAFMTHAVMAAGWKVLKEGDAPTPPLELTGKKE
jgi:hypothetical protein